MPENIVTEFKNPNLHQNDYTLLRVRMDNDFALGMLLDAIVEDTYTRRKFEFPIQLNDAMTFMQRSHYKLNSDKLDFEITGIDTTKQREIEEFYKLCLYVNDKILAKQGLGPFLSNLNWYNIWRGWMASLWLIYKVGNKYLVSMVDADPRNCTWIYTSKGLAQFSYPQRMTIWEAEERFKKKLIGIDPRDKFVDLQCVWTETHELVYQGSMTDTGIKGEPLKVKEHNLGFCPGNVTAVPGLPPTMKGLQDYPQTFSYRGESLLAANRKIYPMLDRLASLIASVAHQGWKAPTVLKSDKDEPFEEEPGQSGTMAQIGRDDELQSWPFRDLNNALTYLNSLLSSNKQKGGLSEIQYGNLQMQVASLVVAQMKDEESGIFVNHRLANKIHLTQGFENIQRMISTNRYYEIDESLVDKENAIEINKSLFEKKYVLAVKYASISPEENISNYTIAGQADKYKDPVSILRDIIHDPDPEGTWEKKQLSLSENVVPGLREFNMLMATSSGNATEESKQEIRNMLIQRYLDSLLDNPGKQPTVNLPGVASQPKLVMGPSSPEKISQKKLNQTGQMDMINARRAVGG